MLSLLLVAGLVAPSLSSPFPAVREHLRLGCSEGWELIDGTCFLLANASGTWDAGHSFCSQQGAFLATVSTQTQQNAIEAELSQDVWIGLIYLKEDLSFGWADGSQHRYTSWYDGEPNNGGNVGRGLGGNEKCVEMREEYGYKWNDVPCDSIRQFLCSRPTVTTTTTTHPTVCEEGWEMFKDMFNDATCYKVSIERVSWPIARDACLAQGAQLAAVTSERQQNFLAARLFDYAWIGLNDREEEGTYTWPDGTEPGYTNWYDGEPNNNGEGEDCTEIIPGGTWNDRNCDAEREFVCQKPPSASMTSPLSRICVLSTSLAAV